MRRQAKWHDCLECDAHHKPITKDSARGSRARTNKVIFDPPPARTNKGSAQ